MSVEKRIYSTVVEATGDEPTITISTAGVDRDSDIVEPSGAELDSYRRNPVVLYGHDHRSIPIGATTKIESTARGLRASWRWLEGDEFAGRVKNAWTQGVLRAASIGFKPIAYEPRSGGGVTFTKWELLEWSVVAVPANPEATRALKAFGLAPDEVESVLMLDDGGGDDAVVFDDADLRRAMAEVMPDLTRTVVREMAGRLTRAALDRARGRIVDAGDLALLDPDSRRVKRAEASAAVADHIRSEVARGLRLARGRVD